MIAKRGEEQEEGVSEARLPGATLGDLMMQSPHVAAHGLTVFFV